MYLIINTYIHTHYNIIMENQNLEQLGNPNTVNAHFWRDLCERNVENYDRVYLPEFLQNVGSQYGHWTTTDDWAVREFFSTYE